MKKLTLLERRIVNTLQGGFPICERPYAAVAEQLELSEAALIAHLDKLLAKGILTRFGPLFQIERLGGAFCLAAMAVPEDRYEAVGALVNARPEIAHNYRREHALNMWFVIATETLGGIERVAQAIEQACGLEVLRFPKEHEYFVELRLRA